LYDILLSLWRFHKCFGTTKTLISFDLVSYFKNRIAMKLAKLKKNRKWKSFPLPYLWRPQTIKKYSFWHRGKHICIFECHFLIKLPCHVILQCRFLCLFQQELTDENRTLNRLVKRQSLALNRLAGSEGELPILLRAHNEETRVLRQKMKQVWKTNHICLWKNERISCSFFSNDKVKQVIKKLDFLYRRLN